jgi:hypothetical protein
MKDGKRMSGNTIQASVLRYKFIEDSRPGDHPKRKVGVGQKTLVILGAFSLDIPD